MGRIKQMADSKNKNVKISKAKGRPMLTWVGKRPLSKVKAYPAQHIESLHATKLEFGFCEIYRTETP